MIRSAIATPPFFRIIIHAKITVNFLLQIKGKCGKLYALQAKIGLSAGNFAANREDGRLETIRRCCVGPSPVSRRLNNQ